MSHNLSVKQMIMALLAALLLIAVPMATAAQDDVDPVIVQTMEFKGVLEAIDATSATVSGIVFDISAAELDDDGPLLVGAMVKVEFVMVAGAPVALEVYLYNADDNEGYAAKLEGLLEAIGEGTITVNGLTIDTTQATFEDGIEVNMVVDVYFSYVEGALVAVRVESGEDDGSDDSNDDDNSDDDSSDDPFEDYHFYGVLESLTATEAIVSGVTFDASRAILDDGLAIGVEVKVEYVIIEGVFVATEIETDDDRDDDSNGNDDDDDRFEDYYHYGVLESLTATEAIVSGVTFDASRAILDDGLAIGVEVKVEYLIIDNVFVATEIETDSDDDSSDDDSNDDSSSEDDGVCAVQQPEGWTTYTVQAGDTLSAIALATDTSLDDLLEVNCIDDPRAVAIGTILYVENEADFSAVIIDDEDDDNSGDDDDSNNDDDDDNGGEDNGGEDDGGDDDGGDDDGGDDDGGDDDGGDDEDEGDGD